MHWLLKLSTRCLHVFNLKIDTTGCGNVDLPNFPKKNLKIAFVCTAEELAEEVVIE